MYDDNDDDDDYVDGDGAVHTRGFSAGARVAEACVAGVHVTQYV